MATLFNFTTGHTDTLTDEQMDGLMHDAAAIMAYLPQNPVYQSLFAALQVQGYSIPEAMADVLRTSLLAGSAKRQIFTRSSADHG